MRFVLLLLLLLLPAVAGADVVSAFYGGANGIWYDDQAEPADFEAGGSGSLSLQPHISLVGSGWYGFSHSYFRAAAGVRVTATDVDDSNFSVGIGIQYHASTEPTIRPEEWCPDASIGWKPWPTDQPKLIVIAQGAYGLTSNQAQAMAGLRYLWGGSK